MSLVTAHDRLEFFAMNYIAAGLTCKLVKVTVKLLTPKQFNISSRFYNRIYFLLFWIELWLHLGLHVLLRYKSMQAEGALLAIQIIIKYAYSTIG